VRSQLSRACGDAFNASIGCCFDLTIEREAQRCRRRETRLTTSYRDPRQGCDNCSKGTIMSGALKGVFGGGGILGGLLNIAGMFFPPLQILGSVANMLTSAIGEGMKQIIDFAVKELGMPKFVGNAAKSIVDSATSSNQNQSGGGEELESYVQDRFGGQVNRIKQDYVTEGIKQMREMAESSREDSDGKPARARSGGANGGAAMSGKSWFVQLAIVLGQALNKQADKVEKLGKEVNETFDAKAAAQRGVDTKTGKGQDKVTQAEQKNFDKMQELQAEAQVMSILANTVSQVVKSVGEGLTTASRGRQ
jgi:hypothetical protein